MTTPHVCHLITRLIDGGAEAELIRTVGGLDGYEFTVAHGASYEPAQVRQLEADGVATKRFPLLRHYNLPTAVPAVFRIANYLRRESFDIVHTHSTEAGIVGRAAANLAGVPRVVHTVHGVPFSEDRSDLLNAFVLACERSTARITDTIVTNADAIAEEYLDRGIGVESQYTTVYSGIDVTQFASADPAPDLPGSSPVVTMVCRLVEGKGLSDLLDAVEELAGELDFTVCVVGKGPKRDQFEAAVRERGLGETVFTLGYRTDVDRILAASDLFVLPSYREGTPRVIAEAMASSLPVVATDIAGIPEQITDGENGYLVEPGDTEALAERMRRLLTDPSRRTEFGAAGRDRVEAFTIEAMTAGVDAVYTELLDDSRDE